LELLGTSLSTSFTFIQLPVAMLATPGQIGEIPIVRPFKWFEFRVRAMVEKHVLVAASGRMRINKKQV